MKRIMVATDGSPTSKEALEVGVDIAAEAGAGLRCDVHVIATAPSGAESIDATGSRETRVEDESQAVPGLGDPANDPALSEAAEFARSKGLEADLELRTGDIVEELAFVAGNIEADLLVVGSRGLGTVKGALLGSVSRRLLDQCRHRPVMVVREGQTSG